MLKLDRKNQRRIKVLERSKKEKRETERYTAENGDYKTVLLVPSTQDHGSARLIEYLVDIGGFKVTSESGCFFSICSRRKRQRFLVIDNKNLSDHETSYVSRYSDLTIVCIGKDLSTIERCFSLARETSRIALCCEAREEMKRLKSQLRKRKLDVKVICREMVEDTLLNLKAKQPSVYPIFIPCDYVLDSEGNFQCEVFLHQGIVSKHFICNGVYEMTLEEVVTDDVYCADKLFQKDLTREPVLQKPLLPFNNGEDNLLQEDCVKPESSENGFSDPLPEVSLKLKYKDFLSLRAINEMREQDAGSYEKSTVLGNHKCFEKSVLKSRRFFEGRKALLRFRNNKGLGSSDAKVLVLINIFSEENQSVVYNACFSSKAGLREKVTLKADNGIKVFEFSPLMSENSNASVFKLKRSLSKGVMTFFAPLFLGAQKLKIYKCSPNIEVTPNDYICTISLLDFKERLLVQEEKVAGNPYKINKRYCVVRNIFTNKDDVKYFQNYELRAPRNNTGIIKDAVGTHGLFKAYFDKPVRHGEKIYLLMYRRAFPS